MLKQVKELIECQYQVSGWSEVTGLKSWTAEGLS